MRIIYVEGCHNMRNCTEGLQSLGELRITALVCQDHVLQWEMNGLQVVTSLVCPEEKGRA